MKLDKLLEENKIEKIEKRDYDSSLTDRDISTAESILNEEKYDWALAIAYNGVLQAARSLMFSLGYRPKGKDQHKTVFSFLEECDLDKDLTHFFDTIRKTRHIAVYDEADYVSEETAKEVVSKAKDFVQEIRTYVQKKGTDE